jgi:hypothetical protein
MQQQQMMNSMQPLAVVSMDNMMLGRKTTGFQQGTDFI